MSKEYIPSALRLRVTEQAKHRCGYCQSQEDVTGMIMEIDHIIPKTLNGPTVEANLWLACTECNRHKLNRANALDNETDTIVPLFNPRFQSWNDHFAWNETGDIILGLTSIGRATVVALSLNRPWLVRARQRWVASGWHPPKD